MKNILLLLFIPLFFQTLHAQTCAPDTSIKDPGYYPENLPVGQAGQSYSETIQFNVPGDTNVDFGGTPVNAIIDSIRVVNVLGLPAGLNYACNPGSCVLPGGETSCGSIYGTISGTASGLYPFVIPIRIYARINGSFPYQQNDTIFKLSMEVDGASSAKSLQQQTVKVYPNPSANEVNVAFVQNSTSLEVELKDVQGRSIEVPLQKDLNVLRIDIRTLPAGIYYGTATNGEQVYYFRFIRN